MTEIKTPVKGYSGVVVGVTFTDGVGETDSETAIAYFERQGYEVGDTGPAYPEGEPDEKWKADQLRAWAADHEVDLGDAKSKADIVAAIALAIEAKAADAGNV